MRQPWATGRGRATAAVTSLRPSLGVFSGRPAFAEPVMVGRPNPVDRDAVLDRIGGALDRNWLSNFGPLVGELEARLADQLEVRHCVTVANGTIGLQLVAQALGLTGEVIVPSFTFVASAHALLAVGIRPVFCDIDPHTHCLDPDAVAAAITPATTGILGVHLWGNPADVVGLQALADRHGLELFFDAAHALGSSTCGRPIGGFGRAEVFSLHPTKLVSAFEGGVITTDDAVLARRLRSMANFGFDGEDRVVGFGINAKMSEADAAMALTSLDGMDAAIAHNADNHRVYRAALADVAGITVQYVESRDAHNRQYVVADVDAAAYGLTRDELVGALRLDNVVARRYFHPGCHRHEPYRTTDVAAGAALPVTEAVGERVLVLPSGRRTSISDIETICALVAQAGESADDVRAALAWVDDPRLPAFARPGVLRRG